MLYRSDIVSDVILAELDAYKSPAQRELSEAMDQIRAVTRKMADLENRLVRIEGFVSDTAVVNAQQQWQLQEMINTVAEALFESRTRKCQKLNVSPSATTNSKTPSRSPYIPCCLKTKWKRRSTTSLNVMGISNLVRHCPKFLLTGRSKVCFSIRRKSNIVYTKRISKTSKSVPAGTLFMYIEMILAGKPKHASDCSYPKKC